MCGECCRAACSVELVPSFERSDAQPGFTRDGGKRYLIFDVESKQLPPFHIVHESRYEVICWRAVWARWCR